MLHLDSLPHLTCTTLLFAKHFTVEGVNVPDGYILALTCHLAVILYKLKADHTSSATN